MSPLDPAELSAFLDGELSAERAREIEAILASDGRFTAAFDALKHADAAWHSAGRAASFNTRVRLPRAKTALLSARNVTVVTIVLVGAHMAAKMLDGMAASLILNAALLGVVVAGFLVDATRRNALLEV